MSSSQTQATRAFLESLFSKIHASSFASVFQSVLSDDLIWTVTGSSPLTGVYHGKQIYLDKVLQPILDRLASPIHPTVERMIVEGEWAAVYFTSKDVKAKNGADFGMQYVWLMKVLADQVVEVVGFYDQKKLIDIFA